MPTNTASWLIGAKVGPLQVKPAPYTAPRENEIVIKNGAVAINPMDWMLQDQGTSMTFTWLKYALVLGADVAGEVVEIGSRVTRFNIDDRVVGQWSCGWYGSEAQQVGRGHISDIHCPPSPHGIADSQHSVLRKRFCAPLGCVYGSLRLISRRSASTSTPLSACKK
jgi:NADPH:quinone reductase-like Zn-dependent oxidoreductase